MALSTCMEVQGVHSSLKDEFFATVGDLLLILHNLHFIPLLSHYVHIKSAYTVNL